MRIIQYAIYISSEFRIIDGCFLLGWLSDLWIICFSGNYGGALGANALAKGLEGNKSLRVQKFPHVSFYVYHIPSLY